MAGPGPAHPLPAARPPARHTHPAPRPRAARRTRGRPPGPAPAGAPVPLHELHAACPRRGSAMGCCSSKDADDAARGPLLPAAQAEVPAPEITRCVPCAWPRPALLVSAAAAAEGAEAWPWWSGGMLGGAAGGQVNHGLRPATRGPLAVPARHVFGFFGEHEASGSTRRLRCGDGRSLDPFFLFSFRPFYPFLLALVLTSDSWCLLLLTPPLSSPSPSSSYSYDTFDDLTRQLRRSPLDQPAPHITHPETAPLALGVCRIFVDRELRGQKQTRRRREEEG